MPGNPILIALLLGKHDIVMIIIISKITFLRKSGSFAWDAFKNINFTSLITLPKGSRHGLL